jgi:hypothetical protein
MARLLRLECERFPGHSMSSQAERFSLATHLYVRLRRSTGRVVDAIWMAQNDEYAREILRLAASDPDPETRKLVPRFGLTLD